MATVNLSVTLSVSDQNRLVTSWQVEANADLNGPATPAQVQTYIKKYIIKLLSDRMVASEYSTAQAAVQQPVPPVLT